MREQPNILLFVSDQQQWRTVCGRSPARSPHVDRLAAEGLRFERPYATVALCCPSRAALLSGQFPWHNGILNQVHVPERTRSDMVPGVWTYSQGLREAGYRLGYSGKWHVSWERTPLDFGFHDVRAPNGYNPETLRAAGIPATAPPAGRRGQVEAECRVAWPGSDPFTFYGIDHGAEETTGAHIATSAAIELIERYGAETPGTPWFVAVNVVEPHDPYTSLARYAAGYDPADVELPASWGDDFTGKPNLNRREAGLWAALSEDQVRTAIARYWAYCEQVDAQVGRALAALDRTGQAAGTLVVFTSDHGDMMGAHRQFIKGWQPYEDTYRVPLVMRWPGVIAPGGVCERIVQLHDLAHLFVDVAGAAPGPADGRSLLPLLTDPRSAGWEDAAFCQYYGGEFLYTQRMVITPRHKYVFNGWDFDELYDLEADPHELRNAVDDPAYRGIAGDLRGLLYDLMERHGDPYAQHRYGAPRYLPRPARREEGG